MINTTGSIRSSNFPKFRIFCLILEFYYNSEIMKRFLLLFFLLNGFFVNAQVGFGTVGGLDIYQRFSNPKDNIAYSSAGNILFNFIYGPKIYAGSKNLSVSLETQVNLGLTSLAIKDFKGVGALSFPVLCKLNFKGLSGFSTGLSSGFAIGAGIQYSKTELFGLLDAFEDKGVKRDFFKTYFAQIDLGYGSFGIDGSFYLRIGYDPVKKSNTFNLGLVYNSNHTFRKKMNKKNYEVK